MIKRIKTSKKASKYLDAIQNKLKLSTKASILRIALSVSLKDPVDPLKNENNLDSNGFEISLSTLYGDYETYYKVLIKEHCKKDLTNDEIIRYIIAHIERGIVIVYGELMTSNSIEQFINKVMGVEV